MICLRAWLLIKIELSPSDATVHIAWNPEGRKKQEKLETLENFGKQAGEDIGSLSARTRRIKEAADLSLVQCVLLLLSFFKLLPLVLQLYHQ
jgi:hypothetical protein